MSNPKVTRHFADGQFGQIHYRMAGKASAKPAIVCLHMVSKSSRSYQYIMPFLAKDRLVIAIDYPGYGESSLPHDESQATIENYARAMWQVLDHLNIKLADLVGYHTGCMVSVCAARQFPLRINKVINIAAPIFQEEEIQLFCDKYAPLPIDEAGTRFIIMWQRILKHRGPGMTLQMCADSMAENLRFGDAYEWGHMAAFQHAKRYIENIKQLSQPLFVMNLNDDMHEHSKRVDEYLQNGLRKDYMHWGAGFLDAYPVDVANEIIFFLEDVS
ncbi:alpha/beta fold hydrolase [Paraglaciecola sp. 20A4]|uniref:alpha/beta fold hydrolase n=1 Tax=Paraglaciecola sp. 20A4 TaxID=2687288 RepID=UPI001408B38D|nr:alpha/beta fold hydrolase [Paraglaciecola sp. 20A4]